MADRCGTSGIFPCIRISEKLVSMAASMSLSLDVMSCNISEKLVSMAVSGANPSLPTASNFRKTSQYGSDSLFPNDSFCHQDISEKLVSMADNSLRCASVQVPELFQKNQLVWQFSCRSFCCIVSQSNISEKLVSMAGIRYLWRSLSGNSGRFQKNQLVWQPALSPMSFLKRQTYFRKTSQYGSNLIV